MSQHEDDGSMACNDCGQPLDIHGLPGIVCAPKPEPAPASVGGLLTRMTLDEMRWAFMDEWEILAALADTSTKEAEERTRLARQRNAEMEADLTSTLEAAYQRGLEVGAREMRSRVIEWHLARAKRQLLINGDQGIIDAHETSADLIELFPLAPEPPSPTEKEEK